MNTSEFSGWRKSTRSTGQDNNCVEVADNIPGVVGVRDSTLPTGPALVFSSAEWAAFTESLKDQRGM
ncbi:hypothetical protein Lfu02_80620 [Longispora fulva]|uniref:DUF397 domain-containing protein n=1 Tax=Longispora fulva TaxID=619741 RepID=A0A8J7KZJ3_9ACTN|nr:DUF397 domain-containing protein [Longispora fulva]MBG6141152.1 hypothetical protein [Longispora fulva]GIG63690.1 hypothetical protein Lfu02_80620 [Longispora fulva]